MRIKQFSKISILTLTLLSSTLALGAKRDITFLSGGPSDTKVIGLELNYEGEGRTYKHESFQVYECNYDDVQKFQEMLSEDLDIEYSTRKLVKEKIKERGLRSLCNKNELLIITDPLKYESYLTDFEKNKRILVRSKTDEDLSYKNTLIGTAISGTSFALSPTIARMKKPKAATILASLSFLTGVTMLIENQFNISTAQDISSELHDYTRDMEKTASLHFIEMSEDSFFSYNEIKKLITTPPEEYSSIEEEALKFIGSDK